MPARTLQDTLVVRGAREHNLKNITVALPRDRLAVRRGVIPMILPASGKSGPLIERMQRAWRSQRDRSSYDTVILVTTSQQPAGINRFEVHQLSGQVPAASSYRRHPRPARPERVPRQRRFERRAGPVVGSPASFECRRLRFH